MPISMHSLQEADRFLGRLACLALQPVRLVRAFRGRSRGAERVLLIKFWGVGSLQLLTPAVRSLRRRHPGARLTLLTLSQNGAFARGLGAFDQVDVLDVNTSSWLGVFRRILAQLLSLRRQRYDAVYDFEFFTRFSAVVSMLSGAAVTRGFASPTVWRGGLHSETVPFNRYWHVARNFRCLAGGENGLEVTYRDLDPFRVQDEHRLEAATALLESGLGTDGPLVVLNPNAGTLSLERRWPQARFAEVGRRLVESSRARVVLIGGPTEREWTGEVAALMGEVPAEHLADLSGRLSLGGLQALLLSADAFVSNDSGPMHLGAAQGAPTVGLFGPETPVMYRPLGERVSVLYAPPPCSPCINVHNNKFAVCWRGRPECLMNLSVEKVLSAVSGQLENSPRPRARSLASE